MKRKLSLQKRHNLELGVTAFYGHGWKTFQLLGFGFRSKGCILLLVLGVSQPQGSDERLWRIIDLDTWLITMGLSLEALRFESGGVLFRRTFSWLIFLGVIRS